MTIQREHCLALCIDVQEKLFPHICGHDKLESSLLKLVQGLQLFSVPLLLSEQYPKGLGSTILALQELCDTEAITKATFSCARESQISDAISKAGRSTLLVFGVESHVCVQQTVLDYLDNSIKVVVVGDCIGSRKESDHLFAVDRMRHAGAIVTSCESLLFELCGTSGTDEFKQLSSIVK